MYTSILSSKFQNTLSEIFFTRDVCFGTVSEERTKNADLVRQLEDYTTQSNAKVQNAYDDL